MRAFHPPHIRRKCSNLARIHILCAKCLILHPKWKRFQFFVVGFVFAEHGRSGTATKSVASS